MEEKALELNHALAFTTIAMKKLGYSKGEIERVTNEMLEEGKNYSLDEAEDKADEILYGE